MSAPLYNRYRRYAERESKRFAKGTSMRRLATEFKKPHTRVYSLSEAASYEAGAWSTSSPGDLLKAMHQHYLPTYNVWIEFDYNAYQKGSNRIPYDSDEIGMAYTSEGIRTADTALVPLPLRTAAMLFHPSDIKLDGVPNNQDAIGGLIFYLYGTGSCFIGPAVYGWRTADEGFTGPYPIPEWAQEAALSPMYVTRHRDTNPRLLKRLMNRVCLDQIGIPHEQKFTSEINGTTRMAIAALSAALSARAHDIDSAALRDPSKPKLGRKGGENHRTVEVDLFLRNRPKRPGGSIRASIGALETIKKGLHIVGGHWAYRRRLDDSDPTRCTKDENHLWEPIEGTKSQVCMACGQKRWFRDQHQRGDEKYGVVPPKTFNVRIGGEVNLSAPEKSDVE